MGSGSRCDPNFHGTRFVQPSPVRRRNLDSGKNAITQSDFVPLVRASYLIPSPVTNYSANASSHYIAHSKRGVANHAYSPLATQIITPMQHHYSAKQEINSANSSFYEFERADAACNAVANKLPQERIAPP